MPTSDSIRRMIAPFSSCKGGAVPRREWLGGRIVPLVATLAESEGSTGADFDSSAVSSIFNRFDGGASVVLSKGSRPLEWGEVECILDKFAPGRCAGMSMLPSRVCGQSDGSLSQHLCRSRKKPHKSCCQGPPRNDRKKQVEPVCQRRCNIIEGLSVCHRRRWSIRLSHQGKHLADPPRHCP